MSHSFLVSVAIDWPVPSAPLLAFDIETAIPIVLFIGWLITWIVKMASGQGQKGPPVANRPRAPARPRDDKLQQEIDIFIQEIGGKKPARQPGPSAAGPKPAPKAAPKAGPAASPVRRGPPPPAAPATTQPPKPTRRVKPGAEIASRQAPVTAGLGTHVRQHLKDYMADKVSVQVAEDLGASQPAASAPAAEPKFVELLRSPATQRQAMIVNLNLAPPPARTARRGR
jgi:hypothetical protein